MRTQIISAILVALPVFAHADTNASVVTSAKDAFGERIGIESIGLYSESQVRGFNLNDAGNYRIDGAYYVLGVGPADPVLAGVITRVGFNALSTDFPAPSGIVDFRLASAKPGLHLNAEAGVLQNASQAYWLNGSAATKDGQWGISAGLYLRPGDESSDGQRYREYQYGVVPEWHPNSFTSVKLFFSYSSYRGPGDYGVVATTAKLPPIMPYPNRYPASWSTYRSDVANTGFIAKSRLAGWDVQASGFYSGFWLHPVDFTELAVDGQGVGEAYGIYTHDGYAFDLSGEVKAGRWITKHDRVFAMFRIRKTHSRVPIPDIFDLGPVTLAGGTPATLMPPIGPTIRNDDLVRQITFGIGDELRITKALSIRVGVQRTRYEKDFTPPGGTTAKTVALPWLYDVSLVYQATPDLTLFATTVKGLEESASAPANAANRYRTLPAALSTQYELGLRGRLTKKFSIIASLFQIRKPMPGFDAANVFRLIGSERHRGIELSLTGQITPALTLVTGVVALEPKISSTLVRSGQQSSRPVGVSSVLAMASVYYAIPWVKGLSVDADASYTEPRLAHASGDLETPGYAILDLGGRYGFKADGHKASLRVYISNLLNQEAWEVDRSQILWRTDPRGVRATFSVDFG